MKKEYDYLTWVEVDLKALKNNYKAITDLAKKQFVKIHGQKIRNTPEILAVIKADAYGHGAIEVAFVLKKMGVSCFGVSDVQEGKVLRKNGIETPVLLFESTMPSSAKDIIEYNLTPTVCTISLAAALNRRAKKVGKKVDIHILVDTGMGRLGIWHEDAEDFIRQVMQFSNLSIKGLYTHFPVADTNSGFTRNQIKQLYDLVKALDKKAYIVPYVHAANSMGLAVLKTHILNLSRPGLMLYGLYPSKGLKRKIKLSPVMSVKTRVILLKCMPKGWGISYGHLFIAPKDMLVAILPIGYNDGYFRCLSNKAGVLINGEKCPVVGRVTMDQLMVDVSHVKNINIGTEVTILGGQNNASVSADELAEKADTINYEIVCSLGNRLPRTYKSFK